MDFWNAFRWFKGCIEAKAQQELLQELKKRKAVQYELLGKTDNETHNSTEFACFITTHAPPKKGVIAIGRRRADSMLPQ